MKELVITRRDGTVHRVLVSDEDYPRVMAAGKWSVDRHSATFYAKRNISRSARRNGARAKEYLHRFILGLAHGDPRQADHIDGNGLNNTRENLRIVSHAEQGQNVVPAKGTSRFRGVSWDARASKWYAHIYSNGRMYGLGSFKSELDAARAAQLARATHFTHANESRHSVEPGALDALEKGAEAK